MLNKFIDYRIFFASLCFGLLVCYLIQPTPRVVYKCPNPDNEDKVTYKDKDNQECYKYKSKEIDCPRDESEIDTCNKKE